MITSKHHIAHKRNLWFRAGRSLVAAWHYVRPAAVKRDRKQKGSLSEISSSFGRRQRLGFRSIRESRTDRKPRYSSLLSLSSMPARADGLALASGLGAYLDMGWSVRGQSGS
jgi:hypothetical protein